MNAKRYRFSCRNCVAHIIWVWLLCFSVKADLLPDLVDDPLKVNPPILEARTLPCTAKIDNPEPLMLGDAVNLALCSNPQVKMTWVAIKTQAAALGEARGAYLPTLSATLSYLNTWLDYPDSPASNTMNTGYSTHAGFNWRLFDFGGRSAGNAAAEHMLSAALAAHDAALQKTLVSVIGAYFDAQLTQAARETSLEAENLAHHSLEATQRRNSNGISSHSDILQAEAALARTILAKQRAIGNHERSIAILSHTLGLATAQVIILPKIPAAPVSQTFAELSHWLEEAKTKHPAILSAQSQLEALREKVVIARSEGLPTLDLTGNYYENAYPNQGLQTTQSRNTTIGITLTLPVFEGFVRTYRIRGAEAQVEQAEAQILDIHNQVITEVVKAYSEAIARVGNIEASEKLVTATQANMISVEKRYAKGAVDVLDLITAQSALIDAWQERLRAVAEWQSARLRLLASAGSMLRAELTDS